MHERSKRADAFRRLRRMACWAGLLLALHPAMAKAEVATSGLKAEFDQIYRRLLTEPENVSLNRRLVEIAVALRDYDAAIGAVERLIFYQPGNAALQIEAARLYLEIDSHAAARGYLMDALAVPSISAAARKEAEALLARIEKETEPSDWAGMAQIGARYQTNANVGPYFLGPEDQFPVEDPVADWNAFALGTLNYSNALSKNFYLEGALSAYYADQFTVHRLDLGFAEFTAGPRLVSDNGRVSLKPYAITQGILLGGDAYQWAWGGGVLLRLGLAEGWFVEPQFEYRDRTYYNSDDYASATDQSGDVYGYAVNGGGDFTDNFGIRTRVAYNQNQAVTDYQSYDQYFASLAIPIRFDFFNWENWSVTPFGSVVQTQYKGVAPSEILVGFDTVRRDLQWNAGMTLEIPFMEHAGLAATVQYTNNQSTLNRFTYDNLQVLFGPTARF